MNLRPPSLRIAPGLLLASALTMVGAPALAVQKTLKFDKFSEDPTTAANEIQGGGSVSCQAGFYLGEAYGVLFTPSPEDYPFDILSIDLVQGDSGDPADTQNDVSFEIYNEDGIFDQPSTAPIFSLSSNDYFIPPDTFGQPVLESTFMLYQFDPSSPEPLDHPPKVTHGNVLVMVQFDNQEAPIAGVQGCSLGCQDPCAITDDSITSQRNVIKAQGNTWAFAESFGVKGDWVLRLVIDAASSGSGSGGSGATSTSSSTTTSASSGAGGAGGGGSMAECNSDADCPNINQVCRAHICQDTGSDATDTGEDSGCGCQVGDAPKTGAAALAVAALGLLARRRRQPQ